MISLFTREIKLQIRQPWVFINAWLFFLFVIFLFGFLLSNLSFLLVMKAVVWIAMLFSYLLGIETLWYQESLSGCLELNMLIPYPFTLIVFSKIITHWLLTSLPLALITLFITKLLSFTLAIGLGGLALSALGCLLSAVTLSCQTRGFLTAILFIPLSMPIVILGSINTDASIALLSALSLICCMGCPLATQGVLRMQA